VPRKRGADKVIGRMYSVGLKEGERYFLRLNLLHVKGATSFNDLRTVDGVEYQTFKDAAKARGLLLDDTVWKATLQEAALINMPSQLRSLFTYICLFGNPSDPLALYNEFKWEMREDYCHRLHHEGECHQCEDYALLDINETLKANNLSCVHFGLPIPQIEVHVGEVSVEEKVAAMEKSLEMQESFNADQKTAFEQIVNAFNEDGRGRSKCFFIDGPGGSGKTYLYTALLHYIKGIGETALTSATTGIAANLLPEGRTVHSVFGLPIPLNETSVSHIKANSEDAKLLLKAKVMIIDEGTMLLRHGLETIDRLFREVTGVNRPFGGKIVVIGGDFRQCLPVIPHGLRPAIVGACILYSKLWKHFKRLKLTINERSEDFEFSNWLLKLGDGTLHNENGFDQDIIEVPQEHNCEDVVTAVFGDSISINEVESFSNKAILCPKNTEVDELNDRIMNILDGVYTTYISTDSIDCEDAREKENFQIEFLNSLTPSGMPKHDLKLKVGCIVMLLRNLNSKKGLCNGTRLIVTTLQAHVIEAKVLTGKSKGDVVLIPRIDLCPSETGLPFKLRRRQFPVKVAFAITINKAQGQTLDKVGIYLPEAVFGHGQLYVAFSRVKRKCDVVVQICDSKDQGRLIQGSNQVFTRNVVYREIFT